MWNTCQRKKQEPKFRAVKTNDLLLGLGLAGLAYYAYTRYTLGSNLNFIPLGGTPGGNGLVVTIGIQNPTSNTATLNSFAGNILANNSAIASVSNFQGMTLAPNAQTQLQFSVTPNLLGLGMDLYTFITDGISNLKFSLVGTANVNNTPL